MNLDLRKSILPIALWILFSLRIFPGNIQETILHSGRIFIGSGLYGLGFTIILNGLSVKFTKKATDRQKFVSTALWLAVLTSFAASIEFYFRMRP